MKKRTLILRGLLWALIGAGLGPCFAENWPGFRGPTGQGISHEENLPLTWSLHENLAWRVQIPGIGWSSPIVWKNRVFLTSATQDGTSCHLVCIDATHGKHGLAASPVLYRNTLIMPFDGKRLANMMVNDGGRAVNRPPVARRRAPC
jgi:hypothetical protein